MVSVDGDIRVRNHAWVKLRKPVVEIISTTFLQSLEYLYVNYVPDITNTFHHQRQVLSFQDHDQ